MWMFYIMDSWTQLQQLLVERSNINCANDSITAFKDLQYEMKHSACTCTRTICCSTIPLSTIGLTGKFCGRACTIFSVLLTKTVLGTSSLSSPGHVSLIGNFPPLSLSQPLCLILTFDNNCDQRQSCSLVEIDHKNWAFLVRWVVLNLHWPFVDSRLL